MSRLRVQVVAADPKDTDAMPMLSSTWARPVEKKSKEASGGGHKGQQGAGLSSSAAVPLPRPVVREISFASEQA